MSKKVSPALIGSKALDENLTHVLAINCNYGLSNFPAKICHGFTQRGDGAVRGFFLCRLRQERFFQVKCFLAVLVYHRPARGQLGFSC